MLGCTGYHLHNYLCVVLCAPLSDCFCYLLEHCPPICLFFYTVVQTIFLPQAVFPVHFGDVYGTARVHCNEKTDHSAKKERASSTTKCVVCIIGVSIVL